MADNTQLNPGVGGDVITTDDLGSSKVQVVKAGFGADGSLTMVRNAQDAAMPVQQVAGDIVQGTITNLNDFILVPCLGASSVLVQILSTTLSGATIVVQGSLDGSSVFTGLTFQSSAAGSTGTNMAISSALQTIPCVGMAAIKILLSAVASGTATINARAVYGPGPTISSILSISGVTPGGAATNLGKAEDSAHASGDVGVMALAVWNDGAAQTGGTLLDYTPISVDAFGSVYTRPRFQSNQGNQKTLHRAISAASTNATLVKGTPGNVYDIFLTNAHATLVRYFKLFAKASAPTVNTDTPILSVSIPPLSSYAVPINGFKSCALGIAYCIVDILADTGQAAIGLNEVTVTIEYV